MVKLDYLPYVISMISDDIIIIIILLYYWLNIFCYQIFLRLYYYNDFNYNYGNSGELLVGYHISNSQYSHTHVLSFIYCLLWEGRNGHSNNNYNTIYKKHRL